MKIHLLLTLSFVFLSAQLLQAQYAVTVVSDPVATQNHLEELAKWNDSIQTLNQQLQQMQQTVQLTQQMKSVVGNPAAAAQAMQLQILGSSQLSQSTGVLTSNLNQIANGAIALKNNGSSLFSPVDSKTPGGFSMSFTADQFKSFDSIQKHDDNVNTVTTDTTSRIAALEQQKAATLAQIQAAPDQSTVQKLTAQLGAIDGQISALGQQQQTATNQLVSQSIANENDRAMKAQAANQAADHEMNISLQNFMQWEGHVTSDRSEFK